VLIAKNVYHLCSLVKRKSKIIFKLTFNNYITKYLKNKVKEKMGHILAEIRLI